MDKSLVAEIWNDHIDGLQMMIFNGSNGVGGRLVPMQPLPLEPVQGWHMTVTPAVLLIVQISMICIFKY